MERRTDVTSVLLATVLSINFCWLSRKNLPTMPKPPTNRKQMTMGNPSVCVALTYHGAPFVPASRFSAMLHLH
jgi:hypothetical protein